MALRRFVRDHYGERRGSFFCFGQHSFICFVPSSSSYISFVRL
jgi:hypothetical protein